MNANTRWIPYCIAALCTLSACSQRAAPAQSSKTADPAAAPATQSKVDTGTSHAIGNPCDVITAADIAGALNLPANASGEAKITREEGNCQYSSKNADVALVFTRTGPGDDTAWQVATTYSHVDVPLAGIGDIARRNADGTTLAARKGNMYCNIQVVASTAGERGEALAHKLGALCSKLFASH